MSTTAVSSSTSAITSPTTSQIPPNPKGQLSKDSFLQMMVTQMQYQDPLDSSSTSPSQMMTQLAQYSQIEALTNIEQTDQSMQSDISTLTQELGSGGSGTLQSLSSTMQNVSLELGFQMGEQMLGKSVTVTDSSGNTVTGVVSSVRTSNGTPEVEVNNNYYPTSSVIQVG